MGEKPPIDMNALREQLTKGVKKEVDPEVAARHEAERIAAEAEGEDEPQGPSLESLRAAIENKDEETK